MRSSKLELDLGDTFEDLFNSTNVASTGGSSSTRCICKYLFFWKIIWVTVDNIPQSKKDIESQSDLRGTVWLENNVPAENQKYKKKCG